MRKETWPSKDFLIADTNSNIGIVYYYQGKHEEALKYLNESLEICKQTLPFNDSRIAQILNNIRLVYEKMVKSYNHSNGKNIKFIIYINYILYTGNCFSKYKASVKRENSGREDLEKKIDELKVIVSNQENKLNEVLAVLLKVLETKKQTESIENDNQKIEQTKLDGQIKQEVSDNENKTEQIYQSLIINN